jgi:hypothetical protein
MVFLGVVAEPGMRPAPEDHAAHARPGEVNETPSRTGSIGAGAPRRIISTMDAADRP